MKTCYSCKQEKDDECFGWKNKAKGIRHGYCRECKKKYQRKYYQASKSSYLAKIAENKRRRRDINKAKVRDYLLEHPCVDCGNADIRILQFDHVRGEKIDDVTRMVHAGSSWEKIENEIAKCDIRCANCHHIKTWGNRWDDVPIV